MTVTVPASLPVMSVKGVLPPGSLLGSLPHLLRGFLTPVLVLDLCPHPLHVVTIPHSREVSWRF